MFRPLFVSTGIYIGNGKGNGIGVWTFLSDMHMHGLEKNTYLKEKRKVIGEKKQLSSTFPLIFTIHTIVKSCRWFIS